MGFRQQTDGQNACIFTHLLHWTIECINQIGLHFVFESTFRKLCYVIFRKVYTYMAWTEICYICWLFLPSYIIIFFQISSFSLFLCLSLIVSLCLACFFTYANNTFFHSIPSYYGNSLLVFMERLTEIPQLSSYRTRPWSIKFIYPIRQL